MAAMNPLESFLVDLKLSASQSALDFSMDDDSTAMDVTIVSDNARMPSQELSESFSSLSFSFGNDSSCRSRSNSGTIRSSVTTASRTPAPYQFSPESSPSSRKTVRKYHDEMDITRRTVNSSGHHRRELTPPASNVSCKADSRWEAFDGKKSPDLILRRPTRNTSAGKMAATIKAPPLYSPVVPLRKPSLESEASERSFTPLRKPSLDLDTSEHTETSVATKVSNAEAAMKKSRQSSRSLPAGLRELPYSIEADESGNQFLSLQIRSVTPVKGRAP